MRTIEFNDREIKLLCAAVRIALSQLNPAVTRIELDADDKDLSEWVNLNIKVSCDECSLDEDKVCTVCGAEWGVLTP